MKRILLSVLISALGLLSGTAIAKASYSPNVYNCDGAGFSITYSIAAWHKQPIWVLRKNGDTQDSFKRQGHNNVHRAESMLGIQISVTKGKTDSMHEVFTLMLPHLVLERFDATFDFKTILIKSLVGADETPSLVQNQNTYIPLKCKARMHLE